MHQVGPLAELAPGLSFEHLLLFDLAYVPWSAVSTVSL